MDASLEKVLELWGFDENDYVFEDGSLGRAYQLTGLNLDAASDEEVNSLKARTRSFLNSLPINTSLQFMFEVGRNYSETKEHQSLLGDTPREDVKALTQERVRKINLEIDNNEIPSFNLYLLLRKNGYLKKLKAPSSPFNKEKKFASMLTEQWRVEKEELERSSKQITGELQALGIQTRQLIAGEVLDLVDDQWNPDNPLPENTNVTFDDVRHILCRTDVEVYPEGFSIGKTHHRVISMKSLPEHTFAGMSSLIKAMPLGSRTFVTIAVPDQLKEIENLKKDRRVAWAMAKGKRMGAADLESEAKLGELENLLSEMISSGEKVFHASINSIVRSENPQKLTDMANEVTQAMWQMNSVVPLVETHAAFEVFLELSIPNTKAKQRLRKVKSSNLADLLPVFTPWKGMNNAVVLLKNAASGSLFKFDPFDVSLTNFNQLISGGSGAGKSYLTNYLLLQALSTRPYIYFVDIGGSYKKLVSNLGGVNIPLSLGNGVSINPFDLKEGETTPSDHKIKFLVGLVELIAKEEGTERLPKLTRSEIEHALQKVYEIEPKPRLSTLQKLLADHEDMDLRKISKILSSWCGDTAYGKFIDRPSTLSLDTQLTAFDLKGLEQFPDLQVLSLYIITDLVWRKIQELKNARKFLVFDECWKLLKSEAGVTFIEECFRTFRKHNASAIAISQDIDDFAKSKISSAILPNCSLKWLLMQPQADGKRLKEVLNLNDNEIATVKSLSQSKGKFSETFLIAQDRKAHLRIEATPLEYWISTTDPRDLAALENFEKEYPELPFIEHLRGLSKRYPQGVAVNPSEVKAT
jgi:conjugal transfer ATP-binding protein TraC